ncbi:MAG: protein kinase [Acidobacteriota bacterium]
MVYLVTAKDFRYTRPSFLPPHPPTREILLVPTYRLAHIREALGHLYDFEAYLGKGAFASVYLVRNRKLERREALKILAEAHDGDHDFAIRFVAEAKMVASLDHPNIVKVYDYGEADGVLWYSMQYIDGPVLRRELEARQRFEPNDAVALAVPLLDALGFSHGHDIVHRDVKPGNILLDRRGRPYLMDFGIAKVKGSVYKTQTGSVMGTPAYVSPEQALGHAVDGRCDLYALGITLYEMLSGVPPFQASDPIQTLIQRLHNDPAPPSSLGIELPTALERAVMCSLERQPDDRYQDAREMQAALLDAFPRDVTSAPVTLRSPAVQPTRLDARGVPDDESPTVITRDGLPRHGTSTTTPALPEAIRTGQQIAPTQPTEPADSPTKTKELFTTATLALAALVSIAAALWWGLGQSVEIPEPQDAREVRARPAAEAPTAVSDDPIDETASDVDPIDETASDLSPAEPTATETTSPSPAVAPPPAVASAPPPTIVTPPPPQPSAPPPPLARQPVRPPRVELRAEPAAESLVRCAGVEVVVKVQIGEQGETLSTRALTSPSAECLDAAIEAIGRYRFMPAVDYAGAPVAAPITLAIRFPEPTTPDQPPGDIP